MNNQLVIGVVLIVVGIALALLAYAFILNRRDQEKKPEDVTHSEAEAPAEETPAEEAPAIPGTPPPWVRPPEAETGASHAPPAAPPGAPPWVASPAPAVQLPAPPPAPPASAPLAPPEQIPPAPPAMPQPSRRTMAVATLLRDEVTGKLSVSVGGREYTSVDELRASKDYSRVEYAAGDLVQWLGAAAVRDRVADRAAKEEAKKPVSMVAQINEILQVKLIEAYGSTRGIRLVEGAGGELRVYLGIQSYSFEDVPDESVRRMIREAVAEWEAKK